MLPPPVSSKQVGLHLHNTTQHNTSQNTHIHTHIYIYPGLFFCTRHKEELSRSREKKIQIGRIPQTPLQRLFYTTPPCQPRIISVLLASPPFFSFRIGWALGMGGCNQGLDQWHSWFPFHLLHLFFYFHIYSFLYFHFLSFLDPLLICTFADFTRVSIL